MGPTPRFNELLHTKDHRPHSVHLCVFYSWHVGAVQQLLSDFKRIPEKLPPRIRLRALEWPITLRWVNTTRRMRRQRLYFRHPALPHCLLTRKRAPSLTVEMSLGGPSVCSTHPWAGMSLRNLLQVSITSQQTQPPCLSMSFLSFPISIDKYLISLVFDFKNTNFIIIIFKF